MMRFFLFLFLSFLCWETGAQCRILSATKNSKPLYDFHYNAQNQMEEAVLYADDGSVQQRSRAVYETGSQVIKEYNIYGADDALVMQTVYTRDARQRVTKMDMYSPDENGLPVLSRYFMYENSDQDRFCLQKVTAYAADGTLLETTNIRYTDDKGSYISTKIQPNGTLSRTETWIRDDKQSYESWTPFPYQSVHNLVAKTIVLSDGSQAPGSFLSVMEYNAQGFPLKESSTKPDGTVDEFEYRYGCE